MGSLFVPFFLLLHNLSPVTLEGLGVPPSLAPEVQKGIELLLNGDFDRGEVHFSHMAGRYPKRPEGYIGLALIYQGRMFENSDFAYDSHYRYEYRRAMKILKKLLDEEGNSTWTLFLKGGFLGIDGLYNLRQRKFLTGVKRGMNAVGILKDCQEMKPDFKDPLFGLGLYDFYRSFWTRRLHSLPFFRDRMEEGLEELEDAARYGTIVAPAAKLALAWAFFDLDQPVKSLSYCQDLRRRFPGAALNNLLLGEALRKLGRMEEAVPPFEDVLSKYPSNLWASYSLAHTLFTLKRDVEKGVPLLKNYIRNQKKKDKKAEGYYLLGQIHEYLGERGRAVKCYRKFRRLGGDDRRVEGKLTDE